MKNLILPFSFCLIFITNVFAQETKKYTSADLDEEILNHIVEANSKFTKQGEVADYIPGLGKANPEDIAMAVVNKNGEIVKSGDTEQKFTIQSISKLIALMIAVEELGEEEVFNKMGYYGTNQAFNHFANLETDGKPLNPMMNAGAILTTAMIEGKGEKPYQKILEKIRYITKNENIKINEAVYFSEKSTGHRNRGIFHILKNNELIEGGEEKLDNYFMQCSIEVDVTDLAKIGYFFANHCTRFDGDKTYENKEMGELIQSQMMIAGMYDYSGEYVRKIGLLSKSGVGGGIIVSVPKTMGIGVYSTGLDKHGNSLAGMEMILDFTKLFELNLFR